MSRHVETITEIDLHAYVGLGIIFYVACEMIYRGAHELKPIINMASTLLE